MTEIDWTHRVPESYQEVLAYLEACWPKTTLRETVRSYPFERLRELLASVGLSERTGEYIGVTGTKGKGSIARIAVEILRQHGLKAGLFSSPHLVRVEERISINGLPIAPEPFAERFGAAMRAQRAAGLDDLGITPLLLALALTYFRDE